VKQVRDREFVKALHERKTFFEADKEKTIKLDEATSDQSLVVAPASRYEYDRHPN